MPVTRPSFADTRTVRVQQPSTPAPLGNPSLVQVGFARTAVQADSIGPATPAPESLSPPGEETPEGIRAVPVPLPDNPPQPGDTPPPARLRPVPLPGPWPPRTPLPVSVIPPPGPVPGVILFPVPRAQAPLFNPSLYGSAEYLFWVTRDSQLPPLVTTGPANPNNRGPGGIVLAGGLNDPGTAVLIGGQGVNGQARSGGRFLIGSWLLDEHMLGVEIQGLFLGEASQQFSATAQGDRLLARPVIDAGSGREVGLAQVLPPSYSGVESVQVSSSFWGLSADARSSLWYNGCSHFDVLVGYRTLALNEDLTISDSAFSGVPPPLAGLPASRVVADRFTANNQFQGGRLGLEAGLCRGAWTLDLRSSVAVGVNLQSVDINGLTVLTSQAGLTQSFPVGLLAASSNIGQHNHTALSVVPDVGLRIGYRLTDRIRAFVGYDLIYWTNVLRSRRPG